jgi:hypothetical protein
VVVLVFVAPQTRGLVNNGTLGGATDGLYYELVGGITSFTFSGSANAANNTVGRIRMPGGMAGITVGVVFDQDIAFSQAGNYALSAVYNPAAADKYSITINTGKTVKTNAADGFLHNSQNTATYGEATYTIKGTLDLTANTQTTNNISANLIAPAGTASKLTVNVDGGTLKTGAAFKADTSTAGPISTGILALNVINNGVVDGTLLSSMRIGKTSDGAGGYKDLFWAMDATGTVKQTVAATEVIFPVGTTTGTNGNDLSITNAGTSDVFTVGIKSTITNTVPAPSKVVNREWTINEGVAGGTVGILKFTWVAADQAASFNPADVVVIASWNGTAYVTDVAVVTGSGTPADPYVATATGITAFNRPFIVANLSAMPLSLSSVKAYQSGTGIKLDWATSAEINTDKFVVEKSAEGTSFTSIGTVTAKGNSNTLSNYTLFDASPFTGNNFYRLKMMDKDGSFTYSAILKVAIGKIKSEVVIAPNPIKGNKLNIQLSNVEKGSYTVNVFNNAGQQILSKTINHAGGSASQVLELPSQIRTGTYQVQIVGTDMKMTKTIIVE